MNIYFECNSGISGDMAVAALIDLGADTAKLKNTLDSLKLYNEFSYTISEVEINAIRAKDFNVVLPQERKQESHHHEQRNIKEINEIINKGEMSNKAKELARRIFYIVAEAESKVHGKDINEIHFHEVGAIDSIVDIVSFAVLIDDINPKEIYFSTLTEGQGTIECQHGILNVPVPAVCEIVSKYKLPIRLSRNEGEMITPTGAAIAAALYKDKKLPNDIILYKTGYGAGKRKYKNPILRAILFNKKDNYE